MTDTPTPVTAAPRTLLADPVTYATGVPYAELARRRREEPVGWVDEPVLIRHGAGGRTAYRGSGYWAVTTHELVTRAARDPRTFSSGHRGAFLNDPRTPADLEAARQLLVNMDDPRHGRIRRVVTAVFTPRAVRLLADSVREHAAAVAAAAAGAGEFDAVTDLAAELPLLVLADLLGIPRADRALLYRWSNHLVGFDDPEYGGGDIDAYRRTFAEAFQYALGIALDRRADPGDDLISRLATAEVDGVRLSDREFCQFWMLLVVAGNETTRHLISNSLQALAAAPDQRAALVADPGLLPTAVDELLRWVTPIMQFRRTATADVRLGGQDIAAGDKVVFYYSSANRDERVFADPDRLRLDRNPNPHLSFGVGPHYCLGAHLARLEAAALLEALLPHLPGLEITGPSVRLESNFVNGVKSLPVRLGRTWR